VGKGSEIACPAAFTCAAVMVFAFHDQDSIVPIRFFRMHLRSRGVSCVYRFQETEGYIESSRCAVCVFISLRDLSVSRANTQTHVHFPISTNTKQHTHTLLSSSVCMCMCVRGGETKEMASGPRCLSPTQSTHT
jgi:hypothetical protein